jgi:hypothetical protein
MWPRRGGLRVSAAHAAAFLITVGAGLSVSWGVASGALDGTSRASRSDVTDAAPTSSAAQNLLRWGAIGDGEHDDTAALARAFRSGREIVSDPGKTYLVRASLALMGTANFRGSTIAFIGGSSGRYIGISAVGVKAELANVTIDGTGRQGSYVRGVVVGLGKKLIARNVHTRDTRGGGGGYGFLVDGTLVCTKCDARGADYGFFVRSGASPKTVISGRSSRNGIGFLIHGKAGGSIPRFTSRDDNRFGILLDDGASHWRLGKIVTNYTGQSVREPTATGFEFWSGNRFNTIDSLVSNGNPGYALAFGHFVSNNRIRSVYADGAGAFDTDPGITLTAGASFNRIDNAVVKNHSVGIRIGEDNTTPNNGNRFGSVYVENCNWSGIRFEYGSGNRIDAATLVNNSTVHAAYPGDISFMNAVSANTIGKVMQSGSSARPINGIYFGPAANRNRVEAGSVTSYLASKVVDENGSNIAAVK